MDARRALVKGGPSGGRRFHRPHDRRSPAASIRSGRELRRYNEDQVVAVITRDSERIARARFALDGRSVSPDATFTLRLAFGTVKGYETQGATVPPFTTLHGLYDRAAGFFEQGSRGTWRRASRRSVTDLDLETPYNFVSTADIIGGNSGSPVINREGELVGLIFDGNSDSLALDYFYTDERARAIAVDARGILEAAGDVYEASNLVQELAGR